MDIKNLIFYIILPVLVSATIVLYFLFDKRSKNKQSAKTGEKDVESVPFGTPVEETKPKSTTLPVTVLLFDSERGNFEEAEISGDIIDGMISDYGSLGRKWETEIVNKKLYHINKYKIGQKEFYRPVQAKMGETRDNPPEDIYRAFRQEAVKIWYNVTLAGNPFAKLAPILIFCGVALFILFMWGTSVAK